MECATQAESDAGQDLKIPALMCIPDACPLPSIPYLVVRQDNVAYIHAICSAVCLADAKTYVHTVAHQILLKFDQNLLFEMHMRLSLPAF